MALGKMAREHLEQELLLSKGGGIYYDNARVDADESSATLFIGLGGTGADMLIRIKNEVKRRMVLPQVNGRIVSDTPNNIGFLAIDTDSTAMSKTWGTATFDQFGAEFCSIAVGDKQAIVTKWKTLAKNGAAEAAWYEGLDASGALPGAGGIRQIGRLLLFENIKTVYDRILQKIKGIIAGGIDKVTVILVAGIAGGTGSGTFIDIAYLARSALVELNVPGRNIFGYIISPDVNLLKGGEPASLKRNGFAALKELDYWMSPSENEQDDQFAQLYGNGVSVRSITSPVFEFCHLLSAQDMNGLPLTYDKVISSMAENVFAYIAGEANRSSQSSGNSTMGSMYDNIDGYIKELSTRAPIPACYRYLAVGSHKLEIPYEEISTLLAIRLFEKLKPTFDLRPNEETFKIDMKSLGLVPKEVIHDSLTRDVPASPLDGNPNYQYGQIWGGENTGPKSNRAYRDVHEWIAREHQPAVTRNVRNWANVQNGYFRNFVDNAMKKRERGPQYLAALIKSDNEWSIIPTLSRMAEHCDDVARTCESKKAEIEGRLLETYNAGHSKILGRQKHINDYLSALGEWTDNFNAIYVYPQRAEAIREFRDKLQIYYDKVFSKLFDMLESLPEIFRQNFDYITVMQKEAERDGKLDDTKLIWPLKYEQEHRADFDRMVESGCVGFLDSLNSNLAKWTGCDLDSIADAAGGNTDVPGFISAFVSEQFGGLLSINMEDIMSSKEGADRLDAYLHRVLLEVKDKSVPMFSMRAEYRNTSTSEFGIVSVPEDCRKIVSAANQYVSGFGTLTKDSKDKTRLHSIKVIFGIPLYAYSKIEEMERAYGSAVSSIIGRGMHLSASWRNGFPTPLPEAAWTPAVYINEYIKKPNAAIREAFDMCVYYGIIRPDDENRPNRYMLHKITPERAEALILDLRDILPPNERPPALLSMRDKLCDDDGIELPCMGVFGKSLLENVRENTLRFPKITEEICKQADILNRIISGKFEK